jgi:DNA-binding MarR family transcriptional regulator
MAEPIPLNPLAPRAPGPGAQAATASPRPRTYAVRLTEKGRRALEDALPGATNADQRLLGGLSSAERRQLLAALDALIEALEA